MNDAACRGLSDIFFPPAAERPQARERREQMA
ncbi:MAG: WhiB family transcriptional regulator, partial [Actinobacteria bacterium]|nr:WhiB family transcriptional regulator [Actinomycetota bacterium]